MAEDSAVLLKSNPMFTFWVVLSAIAFMVVVMVVEMPMRLPKPISG